MKFFTLDAGSCFDSVVRKLEINGMVLNSDISGSIIEYTCRIHPKLAINHRY